MDRSNRNNNVKIKVCCFPCSLPLRVLRVLRSQLIQKGTDGGREEFRQSSETHYVTQFLGRIGWGETWKVKNTLFFCFTLSSIRIVIWIYAPVQLETFFLRIKKGHGEGFLKIDAFFQRLCAIIVAGELYEAKFIVFFCSFIKLRINSSYAYIFWYIMFYSNQGPWNNANPYLCRSLEIKNPLCGSRRGLP